MKSGKASVITRILRTGLLAIATLGGGGLAATGCLDRPVSPSTPNTTNVFVDQIKQTTVDKIDLLFMIDNSISMADKQAFLKDAVPQLVTRLITPATDPVTGKPEFNPVKNIHIGVITSSIGGHGGDVCAPGAQFNETQNDHAHLVPTVRAGLTSYGNKGFLWWDPDQKQTPPGDGPDPTQMIQNFQAHVQAAGEQGCGYEASLEAWYRFLIDPEPPLNVNNVDGGIVLDGIDDVLKQQRADFLRADSLLSVIMLTDENDCSIADVGQNWIAAQANGGGQAFHLPRATVACDTDPNGACCRSCAAQEGAPPEGCGAISADANCSAGFHDDLSDHLNLRCWNQRKRFGIDFLYPTRRYVDGLKNQQVPDRAGNLVPNPLYTDLTGEGKNRDSSLVFLATIVGVPWQDIATPESLTDPNALDYMTADEILNAGRWNWLVPECSAADGATGICNQWNLADNPDDPLMIESTEPRSGTNPATNIALAPATGPEFTPAGIPNGHEYNIPGKNDLQYACVFQLPATRDCATLPEGQGCDCEADPDPATLQSPLCQSGTNYSTTQRYAKGYPGTRHLEVAKDFGANSIVASICPKVTNDPNSPAYGYNPAVSAIIERLKEALNVKCINRPVSVKPDGTVQCAIVEVSSALNGCPGCDPNTNRSDIDPVLVGPVLKQLGQAGQCGATNPNGIACSPASFCMCEINPATDVNDCKTNPVPGGIGWCYVDPAQETDPNIAAAEEAIVGDCNPKRLLRFIGSETPKPGSTTFIACLGAPVSASGATGDGG